MKVPRKHKSDPLSNNNAYSWAFCGRSHCQLLKNVIYIQIHDVWTYLQGARLFGSRMVEIKVLKRPRSEAVITQRKFFKKTAKGKVIKGALLRFVRTANIDLD